MLINTIAATDPALQFVDEMMKHPSVGPKLASHLGDVYKTRWEEAKLGFILTTIKQLEDRKAADDALARGQLPELFAELRKLVTDLQIAEPVEKNMDAELDTNNLKALMGWLWNSKRDLFSEGNMESDMTKGAAIVLRYLEAYRIVYDTRKETEELLGRSPASDHGRRILTGNAFLAGKMGVDRHVVDVLMPVEKIERAQRLAERNRAAARLDSRHLRVRIRRAGQAAARADRKPEGGGAARGGCPQGPELHMIDALR